MKKFEVVVHYEGGWKTIVEAEDEDSAKEIAEEQFEDVSAEELAENLADCFACDCWEETVKKPENKGEFFKSLSEDEQNNGYIKFNIPHPEDPYSKNGEGVWGWVTPEDKVKYNDDSYHGNIKAILLNNPLESLGFLEWGMEVTLKCHGSDRPTIDPEWIGLKLLLKNKSILGGLK